MKNLLHYFQFISSIESHQVILQNWQFATLWWFFVIFLDFRWLAFLLSGFLKQITSEWQLNYCQCA